MKIISDYFRRQFKDTMKGLIRDHGEIIYIYLAPESVDCPNCFSDSITGKSKNVFDASFIVPQNILGQVVSPQSFSRGRCPVCKGEGKLTKYTPKPVRALVKWAPEDGDMENSSAGIEGVNIARIRVPKVNYQDIRDCEYIKVKNIKCTLFSPPVFRSLGEKEEFVVALFKAAEPGSSLKE